MGSLRGATGREWVFQTRGPAFDARRIMEVSGRASDLKCSCATLVYKFVDTYWYLKQKTSNTKVSHWVSRGIETINEHEFFKFKLYEQ